MKKQKIINEVLEELIRVCKDKKRLLEQVETYRAEIVALTRENEKLNYELWETRNLGDEFNAAGLDMKKVLKPEVDIPWTESSVKEYMFNPISKIMFDGRTSSELNTIEIQAVWDVLMRHTGEKHGITVEWPDRFNGGKC